MMKNKLIPWADVTIDDNRGRNDAEYARLRQSIAENGLISRIRIAAEPDGKYRVCAGRRRAKALRYLFPDGLRPEWYDLTEAPEVVSYEENANRQPLTLREDVAQLRELAKLPGMNVQRLAAKLGRSPRAIARRLAVAELPDEMIRLSEEGVTMETLEKLAVMTPEERDGVSEWYIMNNKVERRVRPLPPGGWCAECAGCAHRSDDADGLLFEPEEIGCRNIDCWQGHFGAMLAEAVGQARADCLRVCWAAKRENPYNFSVISKLEYCTYDNTVEGGWTPDEEGSGDTRGEVKVAAEIQQAEEKLREKRDGWMRDQLRATFSSVEAIAASGGGRGIMIERLRDRAGHALFFPDWWPKPKQSFSDFAADGYTNPDACDQLILELFQHDLETAALEDVVGLWSLDVELKKLAAEARVKVPAPKKLVELKAELKRLKGGEA